MGYTTDFYGQFDLDRPMDPELAEEFTAFATRRFEPPEQAELGLNYSYYCQWELNPDADAIQWDGVEKFYDYIPWLKILIDKFLIPNGYVLNGNVQWQGEDGGDFP